MGLQTLAGAAEPIQHNSASSSSSSYARARPPRWVPPRCRGPLFCHGARQHRTCKRRCRYSRAERWSSPRPGGEVGTRPPAGARPSERSVRSRGGVFLGFRFGLYGAPQLRRTCPDRARPGTGKGRCPCPCARASITSVGSVLAWVAGSWPVGERVAPGAGRLSRVLQLGGVVMGIRINGRAVAVLAPGAPATRLLASCRLVGARAITSHTDRAS
jgi:hypothetical protein